MEVSVLPTAFLMSAVLMTAGDVAITEIMYNPDGQTLGDDDYFEWVELTNLLDEPVQLVGMMLSDGNNQLFLDGFELPSLGRVVVAADAASFRSAYGSSIPIVSWDGIWTKLANSGDTLVLYSASGGVVDEVAYSESWGMAAGDTTRSDADGHGSSLEKISLFGVNDAGNWAPSIDYACPVPDPDTGDDKCWGTPGAVNSLE
jgi:hypothetical protein